MMDSPVDEPRRSLPWVLFVFNPTFYDLSRFLIRALEKIGNVIPVPFGVDIRGPVNTLSIDRDASYFGKWWIRWPVSKLLAYIVKPTRRMNDVDLIFVQGPVHSRFDFSRFEAKTAYYALDPHHYFDKYVERVRVENYDYVFVTQKDYVDQFRRQGCNRVNWLPLACDPEYHKDYPVDPDHDVCFIGHVTRRYFDRRDIVALLTSRYKTYVKSAYLHDLARAYSRAKIAFNKSGKGDLNARVFEALACKKLLVSDRIRNGAEDLFVDKKHLVFYDNVDNLIEHVDYYLANEAERESIAQLGQKEVYQKHTYLNRARAILEATELL